MIMKNISKEKIFTLFGEVEAQTGQIVSKTLIQNDSVSITLFAFDKGEEISTHESNGDALVTILDGCGEVIINNKTYSLKTGESILMPANNPHAVRANEAFKMLLIVVFKREEDINES